ncbi:MAG: hypothetical protein CME19_13715 [Gemmatimonadetes bacterium]|nr:hypothetical protein [Gemmatimonadota bacterium]
MIYLSRADVERLLDVKTAIDRMRDAFVAIAEDKVQLSKRTLILLADRAGFFGSMLIPASGFGSAAKVMTNLSRQSRCGARVASGIHPVVRGRTRRGRCAD